MKFQNALYIFAALGLASTAFFSQAAEASPTLPYTQCVGDDVKISFRVDQGDLMAGLYLGTQESGSLCHGTTQTLTCDGSEGSATVQIQFGENGQAVVKVSPSIFWPAPWSRNVQCR